MAVRLSIKKLRIVYDIVHTLRLNIVQKITVIERYRSPKVIIGIRQKV